ncbi:hypothetical protein SSP35_21_00420 [Streptomyces sp. NBRC 110611]|uniref:SAVMC3_10250 family protein n=1 Tax=Streptomyces sp. NBRC 110611 TaxID=1621259 RepID=UPI00082E8159|nr:SAVMC3_10250 family protein [Streptomyces sp. NBRC 110611]GAU70647.1 hypothetical protein SSP35_21_00420 [Streptomyces sp. NBRC 110611]
MPLRRHRAGAMRDLLYLSESKLAALAPQLPDRIRKRLGAEAGLNAGLISMKATLAAGENQQPSPVGALDAVVNLIEGKYGRRLRTDDDIRAGDWIRFEEEFRYGDAWPGVRGRHSTIEGLVYFASADAPAFVLVGSAAHVLDRRPPEEPPGRQVGRYYVEGLRMYARRLRDLPDEAAGGGTTPPIAAPVVFTAVGFLWASGRNGRSSHDEWSPPVRLAGHARVLAVKQHRDGRHMILATPLYLEYAPR